MWHDDHAHFAPPISPTFGGGYSSSGWQREVAAITWLRMVKILGNVNRIKDDHIHAEAIGAIRDIWNALSNVSRWTQGQLAGPAYAHCGCYKEGEINKMLA